MCPTRTVNAAGAMLLVRMDAGADLGAGRCRGHVEHLASGQRRCFDGVASLLTVLAESASSVTEIRAVDFVDPAAALDRDDPHLP